jgi:hypothetical protein
MGKIHPELGDSTLRDRLEPTIQLIFISCSDHALELAAQFCASAIVGSLFVNSCTNARSSSLTSLHL